jgi:nicotinamide riboside kinase
MNITFTGPQSSGKTTLLKKMKENYSNFWYVEEVTRLVKREFHVDINESGATDITQLLIINKELENLFKFKKELLWNDCKGVVHDRCLLDGLVYTEYFLDRKLVSQNVCTQALQYWHKFHSRYDIIFYPNPHDVQLVDDGERSTDIGFRNAIIDKYENYYLNQFQWKERIVILKGTVEERMEQIKIKLHEQGIR